MWPCLTKIVRCGIIRTFLIAPFCCAIFYFFTSHSPSAVPLALCLFLRLSLPMTNTKDTLLHTGILHQLRTVTESAAVATHPWIGRGQKNKSDGIAVDAMRTVLADLPFETHIVISEGKKDNAPQLYAGEKLGNATTGMSFDVAVDPIEGTSYTAKGLSDALSVIAMTEQAGMMPISSSSYYMDKISVCAAAKGVLEPQWNTSKKLDALSQALNKNKEDLTIYVLEKPRHEALVSELYEHKVRVLLYPAGDVTGALLAAMPHSGVDMLLGTGGTPEALLSAVAVKAMGGEFFARFNPQLEEEKHAIQEEGLSTTEWFCVDQLIPSSRVYFCASGLTDGLMLKGVKMDNGGAHVNSMLISHTHPVPQYVTHWQAI